MLDNEFQELRKEVNYVSRDINDLKIRQAKSEILVERTLELIDKLELTLGNVQNTMNDVQIAMVKVGISVENSNNITQSLGKKVDGLDDKISIIEKGNNFNIQLWIKNNWIQLILAGGAISWYIINYPKLP